MTIYSFKKAVQLDIGITTAHDRSYYANRQKTTEVHQLDLRYSWTFTRLTVTWRSTRKSYNVVRPTLAMLEVLCCFGRVCRQSARLSTVRWRNDNRDCRNSYRRRCISEWLFSCSVAKRQTG